MLNQLFWAICLYLERQATGKNGAKFKYNANADIFGDACYEQTRAKRGFLRVNNNDDNVIINYYSHSPVCITHEKTFIKKQSYTEL